MSYILKKIEKKIFIKDFLMLLLKNKFCIINNNIIFLNIKYDNIIIIKKFLIESGLINK